MSELKALYQDLILDHNKSPRNFRVINDADLKAEGFNPLCGDRYTVYVKMGNGTIQDVAFHGSGCAISKASASVMTTAVKGKTKEEAEQLFERFHKLVKGELNSDEEIPTLGKLAVFAGVSEFPARVKCASLAWHTLHAALHQEQEPVSTE